MDYLVVCLTAATASGLTFFSGFGLGTLLMPAFAIFFPVPTAIALTAVVHLLNNLFKFALLGKYAHRGIVLRFGLPALPSAWLGAWALVALAHLPPIATYSLFGLERAIMPIKCVVAILMVGFAFIELLPRFEHLSFQPRYLALGGLLSGFFGGLSGHQGAFRSAFLAKFGLSKEGFFGTGIAIAILIDIARITAYAGHFKSAWLEGNGSLLSAAIASAFLGARVGSRLIQKVTMQLIQILVAILLFGIAGGLASGLI